MHPCITALCGCLYASLHNDFVRPPSCILCTFMNALLVSHPCETLGVHFIRPPCLTRKLRVLPPAAPKIIPRLLSGRKCSGASNCGRLGRRVLAPTLCDRYRASLHVVLALLVSHPCETLGKHYHASLRLRSFGSLHRAATLCDRYRASLHDPHRASSPPHHQKKQGYACLGIALLFWCRWRGSNPHGIATNGF